MSGSSPERFARIAAYRKSINADAAFVCVDKGIQGERLLLCLRLGLIPVECGPGGAPVRVHLGNTAVVRHISVQSWVLSVYASARGGKGQTFDEASGEISFKGKSFRNWLWRESRKLLQQAKKDCILSARYRFQERLVFQYRNRPLPAEAMEICFACRIQDRVHSLQAGLKELVYQPHKPKEILRLKSVKPAGKKNTLGHILGMPQAEAPKLAKDASCRPQLLVYHPVAAADKPGQPDFRRRIPNADVSIKYS
ncbi:MAG: hypothetical protein ABI036_15020 [Fibrobacteria bacterium]